MCRVALATCHPAHDSMVGLWLKSLCGALFSFYFPCAFVCQVVKVSAPVFAPVLASFMAIRHGKQFLQRQRLPLDRVDHHDQNL